MLFAVAAFMSAVNGFHRPALEAMTPKLVTVEELPAVSALSALRRTVSAIAGPALAGICIAAFGLPFTFGVDAATFAFSLAALAAIRAMPPAADAPRAGLSSIVEGLRYATRRPELVGTYLVDIVAMTFAMPTAVFPALAEQWGGASAVGYLVLGDERRRVPDHAVQQMDRERRAARRRRRDFRGRFGVSRSSRSASRIRCRLRSRVSCSRARPTW